MPYQMERHAPHLYFCLWTGDITAVGFRQAARERTDMVKANGDAPYVFVVEMRDVVFREWDVRVVLEIAELQPSPYRILLISDHPMTKVAINVVRLFVKIETLPTVEAAFARARELVAGLVPATPG